MCFLGEISVLSDPNTKRKRLQPSPSAIAATSPEGRGFKFVINLRLLKMQFHIDKVLKSKESLAKTAKLSFFGV